MTNRIRIGIIAEDTSDVAALEKIITKIRPSNKYFFRHVVGKGHANIIRSAKKFSKVLFDQGCTYLIVIRDSDGKSVLELKKDVKAAFVVSPISKQLIIVAVEEMEGWLLSDIAAIHSYFCNSKKVPKEISSPETIKSPKEYLKRFVQKNYKKKYLNTKHNEKIAEKIEIKKLVDKCPSFLDLFNFIKAV
jgi:hypothetical protein